MKYPGMAGFLNARVKASIWEFHLFGILKFHLPQMLGTPINEHGISDWNSGIPRQPEFMSEILIKKQAFGAVPFLPISSCFGILPWVYV